MALAGVGSVEELASALAAAEDSNFRLFAYVGEVNSEADALEAATMADRAALAAAAGASRLHHQSQQRMHQVERSGHPYLGVACLMYGRGLLLARTKCPLLRMIGVATKV